MKKIFFAMFAVVALLLGMTSCTSEDNPAETTPVDVNVLEQDLVGLWWEEFDYSDVTEEGEPFNHVLLAVSLEEDHTGTLYLAVYDDQSDEPLNIYGGSGESDFTWKVLEDGSLELGDPVTGETFVVAAATRADGNDSSYGSNMTTAANTSMTVNNNNQLVVQNGSFSGTLNKASGDKVSEIQNTVRSGAVQSNVSFKTGGKTPEGFDSYDIR